MLSKASPDTRPRLCGVSPSPVTSGKTVFVIGPARSDTKILRDLIGLHPDVATVPFDVNYIWRIGNEALPHDELVPGSISSRQRASIVRRIERYRRGRNYLVEKTVSNCVRVPFVSWVYPGARYILLERDIYDTVESVRRQWTVRPNWRHLLAKASSFPLASGFTYAFDYLTRQVRLTLGTSAVGAGIWGVRYEGIDTDMMLGDLLAVCTMQTLVCARKAQSALTSMGPAFYHRVSYEELVQSPSTAMDGIASFLELDPEPFLQRDYARLVTRSNIGKGIASLEGSEIERITRSIDEYTSTT